MECGADLIEEQNSMSNNYLKLIVEQNSQQLEYLRFCLETKNGEENNKNDDNKPLTYKNFFSGYTTININGQNFIYGSGKDIITPYFDNENGEHVSSQEFNGIEVEQRLCFNNGFSNSYEDMLKVTYKIKNNNEDAKIGVRILIDPMLEDDDSGYLKIDNLKLTKETEFSENNIPATWFIESDLYPKIHAYGKIDSSCIPDKLIFAEWSSLYDNRWNYSADINKENKDIAAAFIWNEKGIEKGESSTYSMYYGVKNTLKVIKSNKENKESTDINSNNEFSKESDNNTLFSTGDNNALYLIVSIVVSGMIAFVIWRKSRCK